MAQKKNLPLNPVLVEVAEKWGEPRKRSLTSIINEAMEEWAKARGIDPFDPKAPPAATWSRSLAGAM